MTTPEGKVKEQVKKLLKEQGVWFYMPVQSGFGTVGVPDIVACTPVEITEDMVGKTLGVFTGIETKAPGKLKNTTPNQKRILRDISEAFGVAVVAENASLVEAVIKHLRATGLATYYVP